MTFTKEVFPEALCIDPGSNLCEKSAARCLETSTCSPTMEISAVFEKNNLHFRVQSSLTTMWWIRRQTHPESHWNREVYQVIVVFSEVAVEDVVAGGADHGYFVICYLRVSGRSSFTRLGLFLSSSNVVSSLRTLWQPSTRTFWNGCGNTKGNTGRNNPRPLVLKVTSLRRKRRQRKARDRARPTLLSRSPETR